MSAAPPVLYEEPVPNVARIVLNRPEVANAQSVDLLYALNDAMDRAAHDDDVRVIVLAANGKHFSSGHDLAETDSHRRVTEHRTVGTMCGFGCQGAEAQMSFEEEVYLGFSERWRNIPKPLIAAVQGKVIAGGLMLVWPCDLIIAADDASFSDPTVSFGVNGVEFFHHVWELGARRAKEMLFLSEELSAHDAERLGMVCRVVPRADLLAESLALATRIAGKSRFALKMAKTSINAAQDAQGRPAAMAHAFHLHQLAHTHWLGIHGVVFDPTGLPEASRRAVQRGTS